MGFRDDIKRVEKSNLEMPPILDEIGNLMETVGDTLSLILRGKSPLLSKVEKARRLAICNPCEKYDKSKDRCSVCGCNMPIKTWLAAGYCKLGKFDTPDKVSVLIAGYQEKYLDRTVANLAATAEGPIEILTLEDNKQEGKRVILNRLAKMAVGRYLYIVDAHCRLTESWDVKMKASCGDTDLVVSLIDSLIEDTWRFEGGKYGRVYLDKNLVEKWWAFDGDGLVQETMGLTGCSIMLTKKRFWELGGYDESLSRWGSEGPEWALKIWLSGGKCLLRTDVTCGHLFRKPGEETHKIPTSEIAATVQRIKEITNSGQWPLQEHSISWLVGRFKDVPTWDRTLDCPQ